MVGKYRSTMYIILRVITYYCCTNLGSDASDGEVSFKHHEDVCCYVYSMVAPRINVHTEVQRHSTTT